MDFQPNETYLVIMVKFHTNFFSENFPCLSFIPIKCKHRKLLLIIMSKLLNDRRKKNAFNFREWKKISSKWSKHKMRNRDFYYILFSSSAISVFILKPNAFTQPEI